MVSVFYSSRRDYLLTILTPRINTIPNNGLIRYRALLNQERLLVASPQALSEVLVTKNYDFVKPSFMRWGLGRILGIGILLAEGDEHRAIRKSLMPAFAFRHVKDLYPVFWAKARESVLAMSHQVLAADDQDQGAAVLEVSGWASRVTLDIIGVAGMGHDFRAVADPTNKLFAAYKLVFAPSGQARLLQALSLVLPIWLVARLPVRRNGDVNLAARTIRQVCVDLIRDKKAKLARKELHDVDILSIAIESGGFSEDNLVAQCQTFLAAGHETTASSLVWGVYLLCCHPEVQARLRQEVRECLPPLDNGSDAASTISFLDIDRMPYLNAVVAEVLRYMAPVPLTLREAAVDTTIQGQRVPKGTRIVLAPRGTNRDVALWGPDANQFRPERWLLPSTAAKQQDNEEQPGEDGKPASASGGNNKPAGGGGGATSNYAFLTFLHGPRSCIASAFAKAEFACLLAAWVGRFEFALEDPALLDEGKLDIKAGVTARPSQGLRVKTRVLDGW